MVSLSSPFLLWLSSLCLLRAPPPLSPLSQKASHYVLYVHGRKSNMLTFYITLSFQELLDPHDGLQKAQSAVLTKPGPR